MKKENLISLLKKIEKHNIKNVEEILNKDESLLLELNQLNNNNFKYGIKIILSDYEKKEDILSAIKIIHNTNGEKATIISKILTNKKLIERKISIDCAKVIYKETKNIIEAYNYLQVTNTINRSNEQILNDIQLIVKSKTKENANIVIKLLVNQDKYPKNIVEEGLKILQNTSVKKIHYIYNVLTNEISIKYGLSLEGAKLLSTLKNDFSANCAEYVLTNDCILKKGIAIEIIKILNEYTEEEHCMDALDLLDNQDIIQSSVILESIKLVKKSKRQIHAVSLYDVLTNKKLIESNLSLNIGNIIVNSTDEEEIEYISEFSICKNVNTNIVIDGCKLLQNTQNKQLKQLVFRTLINEELNKNNKALICAKKISTLKSCEKAEFIVKIVLNDKNFSNSEYILEIIDEIGNSTCTFSSLKNKPKTKYSRIIEFGIMYINRCINININKLNCLMENMKKLSYDEIELIIKKFDNLYYRIKFMKLLSNENNMSPEIINFLKKKTKTKGFDKKEKQDIEEHIDVQIKDNNKDTDIQILLELIEEEPEEEIKTDLIIKKLIKRKETKN